MLYHKLIFKSLWKSSTGIGEKRSKKFVIKKGVKKGVILPLMLFNLFIDDLLHKCTNLDVGACIGSINTSIIAYCDDLILLSPLKSHLKTLLRVCEEYAADWGIKFNPLKSTIYCTNKQILSEGDFLLCGGRLRNVENFQYLGLPIGDRTFVEEYMEEKFRSVEKAFFSIRQIGLHKDSINPFCLGFIYKQFCQSIFVYGLELIYLNKRLLGHFQSRQGVIIKLALNLSKFVRTTPLLESIFVIPILELYFKFKYLFLKQIPKNRVAHSIFTELSKRDPKRNSKESFITQLKELESILVDTDGNKIDPSSLDKKGMLDIIRARFARNNRGLVDSVRTSLCCRDGGVLLRLLLAAGFHRGSPVESIMVGVDDFSGDLSAVLSGGASLVDPGLEVT